MPDKHQEALNRQQTQQQKLEDAMQRQETPDQRDQHLHTQIEWLTKQ